MIRPKIAVHMLVENEIRWAWYALQSVLPCVNEVLLWDLGSTDGTAEVLQSISDPKIRFHSLPGGGGLNLTATRQLMLAATRADWLLLVDGDEIWPTAAITECVATIRQFGQSLDYLIQPYYNLLGDIYHYQETGGGNYRLAGLTGHNTIRAVNLNRIAGLHFDRPHGQQGLFDSANQLIQAVPDYRYRVIAEKYLHTTHLRRSATPSQDVAVLKRARKYKYELGITLPSDFAYPPCLYLPHPPEVPTPWATRSLAYTLNAAWQTPLKWLKRRIITPPSGY